MSLNGPAAARLYDEHVDAIYTYAARRVGPDAAVSVVEEVFEQALRKNAERPPRTASDLGWLLAMATAFLRRHSEVECRRLQAWEPVQRDTSRAIPRVSDPLLSNDAADPTVTMTAQVMAAVADLEPVERDVLFLVAWEGCSSALTATATGLPQNEIRATLTRIRREIRSIVSGTAATDRTPAKSATTEPAAPQPPVAAPPTPGPPASDDPEPEPVPAPTPAARPEPQLTTHLGADFTADFTFDADATEPLDRPDDLFAPFEDPS